jgi:hypothetical protein
MRTNRNNNKNTQTKEHKNRSISCEKINSNEFKDNFFKKMDIKDDFIDPIDNMLGMDALEDKMLKNFRNSYGLLLDETEEKNNKKEKLGKMIKYDNETFFSKVYCSSYNNIDGKEHEEKYQSQGIKQINNGHNISKCEEAYNNSDGLFKSSYQISLDKKGERFIKEKNTKTGEKKEHKVIKGMKENEINDFENEYNDYSNKIGFKNNCKCLDLLNSFDINNEKLITDGKRLNKKTNRH